MMICFFLSMPSCLQHLQILCLVRNSQISKLGHVSEVRAWYPTDLSSGWKLGREDVETLVDDVQGCLSSITMKYDKF